MLNKDIYIYIFKNKNEKLKIKLIFWAIYHLTFLNSDKGFCPLYF